MGREVQSDEDAKFRHALQTEGLIVAEGREANVITMSGALMLARGAYLEMAACNDPDCEDCKKMRVSGRNAWKVYAAKQLNDAFQIVELMMTQTKGHA